ncbi:HAD-IIB family hydrolase [Schleiferilactobacillus perolens]|uniref:HAD superfamily hydrolase n=1 Tax=Schleiferilactobacillus perolens DSM 12744 TaxID=1423792 RepID=A0A0R1N1H5_9LACO|nr:HAD-IIB family hydrolase [Schleiferilactobacillus perolens]KRL11378.1 hypothetical protein FD09_GL000748 [Schleiferilactobacillus perolens DSM 12744]
MTQLIQAICSDLDGTLLDDDKQISTENVVAIRRWQQAHRLFGITSGRQYDGVIRALAGQVEPDFVVCLNGAEVHAIDGRMSRHPLTNADAQQVLQILGQYRFARLMLTMDGKTYLMDQELSIVAGRTIASVLTANAPAVEKIGLQTSDPVKLQRVLAQMAALPVNATWSDRQYVEISGQGVSKFSGLREALSGLVPLARVAAVGDYGNDMAIVKGVGRGYAVANAVPTLKKAADALTTANTDAAIAHIVAELLPKEEK